MRPTEASPDPPLSPRVIGLCQTAAAAARVPRAEFTAPEQAILDADGADVEVTEAALRASVKAGRDLLGDLFCELRSAEERRPQGATYTPAGIVDAMLAWAGEQRGVTRVVDAGAGSGRFTIHAARTFPAADIVAVELDPIAAILLRANVHAAGVQDRVRIVLGDYRELKLDACSGTDPVDGKPALRSSPPDRHDVEDLADDDRPCAQPPGLPAGRSPRALLPRNGGHGCARRRRLLHHIGRMARRELRAAATRAARRRFGPHGPARRRAQGGDVRRRDDHRGDRVL